MRKLEETEEVNLSNNLAHELAQIMNQIRFTLDAEIQGFLEHSLLLLKDMMLINYSMILKDYLLLRNVCKIS